MGGAKKLTAGMYLFELWLMPDVDRCQSRIGYTPYPQAWT